MSSQRLKSLCWARRANQGSGEDCLSHCSSALQSRTAWGADCPPGAHWMHWKGRAEGRGMHQLLLASG